jgi:hypothetical protein
MTRTVATALPVWVTVIAAVIVVGLVMPSSTWWEFLPVIAGGAMVLMFVIQVGLQSKDGLVNRMLVTATGVTALLIAASVATLLVLAQ